MQQESHEGKIDHTNRAGEIVSTSDDEQPDLRALSESNPRNAEGDEEAQFLDWGASKSVTGSGHIREDKRRK